MKNYNVKSIKNHANDYWIIADLLKEYYDNDITDDELEKRLKNVDKVSLLHVCHFLDIDRKWYEKQYDMNRESYKLYIQRHK
jgi:hypothetical protein